MSAEEGEVDMEGEGRKHKRRRKRPASRARVRPPRRGDAAARAKAARRVEKRRRRLRVAHVGRHRAAPAGKQLTVINQLASHLERVAPSGIDVNPPQHARAGPFVQPDAIPPDPAVQPPLQPQMWWGLPYPGIKQQQPGFAARPNLGLGEDSVVAPPDAAGGEPAGPPQRGNPDFGRDTGTTRSSMPALEQKSSAAPSSIPTPPPMTPPPQSQRPQLPVGSYDAMIDELKRTGRSNLKPAADRVLNAATPRPPGPLTTPQLPLDPASRRSRDAGRPTPNQAPKPPGLNMSDFDVSFEADEGTPSQSRAEQILRRGGDLNGNLVADDSVNVSGAAAPDDSIDRIFEPMAPNMESKYDGVNEETLYARTQPRDLFKDEMKASGGPDTLTKDHERSEEQLVEQMAPYVRDGFIGVKAADEIDELGPLINKGDQTGFILNKSARATGGSHWVAVFIAWSNTKHHAPEIDYYDPFGDPPPREIKRALKELVKTRKGLDVLLKFKVNRVPNQSQQSSTCGYQSMRFLQDMFKGKSFKDATNFTVAGGEAAARALIGGKCPRFGYM